MISMAARFGFGQGSKHGAARKRGHHHGEYHHGYGSGVPRSHGGPGMLTDCSPGAVVRVIHLSGGPEARRKMLDLGIVPGEELKVSRNDGNGPLLVLVRGTSMMIGRGLADKIRVVRDA